ncbi:capsular polysaccharide biosynthesis protein [Ketogulonicigenium vulgare]|uniref:Capsule polysaccharide biosynthesis protein n=2 Tax=Ketogulonicigenium vulgare TaxID=92945 RepID=F9Y7E0_KETVW|nr:capsular polysaccharide biosynthesis protein [Ketogulonicigenium vulgare]AEM41068.1 Capsule polysaccharide biosynthesis protein [Ketogulonicigenium vulgare WSH-001]ALJ81212.1 capsular biosynthesis protein [Ketogulonicigenium vulgare]ANW33954.1 capsular biosynthesis protein [Ketogulonicigenium vulgare]
MRLRYFNLGFLRQPRVRRIMQLAGYDLRLGWPSGTDGVVVWGQRPVSARGRWVARRSSAPLITVEDAFLRSVLTGRAGEPPQGLLIDPLGLYYDPSQPSTLENLLSTVTLTADEEARAARLIARLNRLQLSKYNATLDDLPPPAPGYVLIVDQTAGDASVRASGGDRAAFLAMLQAARDENPGARILIRSHPETTAGQRGGHFRADDLLRGEAFIDAPYPPQMLLSGAAQVYTLSSQLGFEAILNGRRPAVFGQPFYAGWGLSDDRSPPPRRGRALSVTQLFTAAMIQFPKWYDPHTDQLCEIETVIDNLEAQRRAWREDRMGWLALGMRLWKRGPLQRAFGRYRGIRFKPPAGARRVMVWANRYQPEMGDAVRVEDGFLRSRGLGAELVPPASLVLDDLGIYYDPTRPSRLETLIEAAITPDDHARATALIATLNASGISKYNLGNSALPDLPPGRRILVPGQVEDDASIRLGAGDIRTNAGLLRAVRAANPDAVILWKPHPDVEAGLRPGAVADPDADVILRGVDAAVAISAADEVWTMTSTLGFEALLRGKAVTCYGAPFYAGWGLTQDLGSVPARRSARPDLATLAHAVLIAYPRYFHPKSGLPCPPEAIAAWLQSGAPQKRSPFNRLLAKVQGALASFAWIWR